VAGGFCLHGLKIGPPRGRLFRHSLSVAFLEFHGATITSGAALLACRELDDALGLTQMVTACLQESRGGRSVQHQLVPLLRQSVYSRLAGYEDTNDAVRLARDPAIQIIAGRRALARQAASTNTVSRFETEVLVTEENLKGLERLNATRGNSAKQLRRQLSPNSMYAGVDGIVVFDDNLGILQGRARGDGMDLDTVMLADFANADADGKLNVMGVFNIIRADGFPVRHAVMYVVTIVSASMAEVGSIKKIGIKLIDEDAKLTLLDFSRDVTVEQRPSGKRYRLNGVLRVNDIVFPQAGTYQISVLIDGQERGTVPIYLEQN